MANSIRLGGGGGGSSSVIVSKTITTNGTYNASADSADGYNPVIVNVEGGGAVYTVNSNDTPIETNTQYATVENNSIYLFSTVYNQRTFDEGCEIIAGSTNTAYDVSGLGRAWAIIKTKSTIVGYSWYGAICPNKYNKIDFEKNNVDFNNIVLSDYSMTASDSFSSVVGQLYIVGTAENAHDGVFTGADVICHNVLGDYPNNNKFTAFYLIKATAQTVTYSKTIQYLHSLDVGEIITFA